MTIPPQPEHYPAQNTAHVQETTAPHHANHMHGYPVAAAPEAANTEGMSRTGVLLTGIIVGALVGGLIGGGAAALVAANQKSTPVSVTTNGEGRVVLNNLETATTVTGVALAATQSVVTLEVTDTHSAGSGSGVVYSEDGYIVTNAHVILPDENASGAPDIRVWLSDGRILDGTLVGADPYADLAVVKVQADNLTPIEVADSDEINVGDLAVAIGAPLSLSNTVTSGVVSALNRGISVGSPIVPNTPEEQDGSEELPWFRFDSPEGEQEQSNQPVATRVTLPVVQTDASINPGNSGGALLNANAKLIGINVAIASNGSDETTAGSDGLGFAIPSNLVTRVVESLIAGERPSHGLLGIGAADSVADTDRDRNIAGGLISEIVRGGAADKGGLKVGDVITAVNGLPADSGTAVSALIRMHEGGDEVVIAYSRDGVAAETTVVLDELQW